MPCIVGTCKASRFELESDVQIRIRFEIDVLSDVSAMSDSDVGDQQMLITVLTDFQNFVDVPFI